MTYTSSFHYLRKIFALVAATLILPALAHAGTGTDNGKGNDGQNNGNQYGKDKGDPVVSNVPEANTAIVLIPFLGAVLVVGSMHLWRRQKNASV